METLEEKIKKLPPELKAEVAEFVEALLKKKKGKKQKFLEQNWAGALAKYRDKFTSLELQKKSLEWRGD